MKLHTVLMCSCLILILTVVKAQRTFKISKPIVDLNARPQVTTTPKPPEERRKLSIFPKNMAKFVVTSKPYSKVRTYSPWQVSTKKPLMQKMLPSEAKTSKFVPVTKPSQMKFTYKPNADQISKEVEGIDELETTYENIHQNSNKASTAKQYLIFPNENNNENAKLGRANSRFVARDFEPDAESTQEVSTFSSSANVEKTNKDSSTERDLENSRRKRLSIRNFGEYNNIDAPSKADLYSLEERKDSNEFIFIKEKLRPVYNKQPTNIIDIEEDMEIATETIWLEESTESRPKRSITNVIEEENLGTTISGFKFTGREPQLSSHLAFKNINA